MKGLGLIDKFILFINSVFALCLLLSLLVLYIPPERFPQLSVLSLGVSPLLVINVIFFLFWLLRVKKQLFLSLFVLAVCFVQFNKFYQFDFSKKPNTNENHLKVMSYNVRIFNLYNWIKEDNLQQKLEDFIKKEKPDVISFQEYYSKTKVSLTQFPYKYIKLQGEAPSFGQAIYSKYPIVNSGSLDFKNTGNNAIFADIVKGKDTIRIYNIHLESLQINQDDVDFKQEASKRLFRRIAASFKIQQNQINQVVAHKNRSKYKTIVTADLNNTAFSFVYRKLKGNMKDAFSESGKGLGKTYTIKKIPLRIDFILTDEELTVEEFNTHTVPYSDHFPISAVLSW